MRDELIESTINCHSGDDVLVSDLNGQPPTILVVEDSPLVLSLITELLITQGYQVVGEVSAESALSTLPTLRQPPALIISDVRLGPGMNGLELLQRSIAASPGQRGILMSGAFDEPPGAHQPFAVLRKPFDPETLLTLVARVIHAN
jgi:CheY-like chemotaxis protein